ncbi:hypothetical protein EAF04_000551 [Stromatinia cepivora]|nr:hypothetical protein EAF04_000551 [Stromatinia cepivora]
MAVTKCSSHAQYDDPRSSSSEPPDADLDQISYPSICTSYTIYVWEISSHLDRRPHRPHRPRLPSPEHPCTYGAITWERAKSDEDSKYKGFCVIFHANRCVNFTPKQSNLYECCKKPNIVVVEERKGFCYGPHCPGFEELGGKDRPVPNPPYRFDAWFYRGVLPERLFPELTEERLEEWFPQDERSRNE